VACDNGGPLGNLPGLPAIQVPRRREERRKREEKRKRKRREDG